MNNSWTLHEPIRVFQRLIRLCLLFVENLYLYILHISVYVYTYICYIYYSVINLNKNIKYFYKSIEKIIYV